MKFKIILSIVLTVCLSIALILILLFMLATQDGQHNAVEGRDVKEVTIYKDSRGEIEDRSTLTVLGEQDVEEFENLIQNVTQVKQEDVSPESNYTIELIYTDEYVNSDEGGMGLDLGNDDEKSYIITGKNSNSEWIIFELSAAQTTELRKMINK